MISERSLRWHQEVIYYISQRVTGHFDDKAIGRRVHLHPDESFFNVAVDRLLKVRELLAVHGPVERREEWIIETCREPVEHRLTFPPPVLG